MIFVFIIIKLLNFIFIEEKAMRRKVRRRVLYIYSLSRILTISSSFLSFDLLL